LSLANKGVWAKLLGVGDFYFEMAVQILEIAMKSRENTGGLLSMRKLIEQLSVHRKASSEPITEYPLSNS
jgi:ESCRT-II complex subunit VPS22